jgi:ankyrin repeat protein
MDIYLGSTMTQESPARGSNAKGKSAASAARDMEEGVDNQSASFAAQACLKGVTPDGNTALHEVASNGDGHDFLMCVDIICSLDSGLLFAKNHKGDTPLHCGARAGNSNMVSHLLDLAAREGADKKLNLLRAENNLMETALHEAVRNEDGRLLGRHELASPDADRKKKNGGSNKPEEKSIVKLLMGADPELANHPADGISPFYLAILLEKSTIALTLYDMSAGNLSYAGPNGQNALHVALLRDRDIGTHFIFFTESMLAILLIHDLWHRVTLS